MVSRRLAGALCVAAVAGVGTPVALAGGTPSASDAAAAKAKPKTRTVTSADDYYLPLNLKVKAGTKVKWVWPSDNSNSHDVKLKSGPKGEKKFWSPSAAADFTWSKTFKTRGVYKIICTLHEEMTMKITVTK